MQFFSLESDQGTMIFTIISTTLENLFGPGNKKSGPIPASGRVTLLLIPMLMLLHTQNETIFQIIIQKIQLVQIKILKNNKVRIEKPKTLQLHHPLKHHTLIG